MEHKREKKTTALALFSGGLDSLLACKIIAAQGICVYALKFVSPFFEYDLLAREAEYKKEIFDKYGIKVILKDISADYIQMIRNPAHGYGKHFNPCVDCKIFMVTRAKEMLTEYGASFLITGEVIGQRPMSQRRDTLQVIARNSGCSSLKSSKNDHADGSAGILLRPLCAKNLDPTQPELEGLVDRENLYGLSGRSRTGQIELARKFGIVDYPAPAGGCILTDPVKGKRIKEFYERNENVTVADMRAIVVGRQFSLPYGGWLVMGRDEAENDTIEGLAGSDDVVLKCPERPGPTALLRRMQGQDDLQVAADLVVRYAKKNNLGQSEAGEVVCKGKIEKVLRGSPLAEEKVQSMVWKLK